MKRIKEKLERHKRRKFRIRKKISGSSDRPRLTVFRSNRFTYLQAIDDTKGLTITAVSNKEKDFVSVKNNMKDIVKLGTVIAERLKEKKIETIVFDRNGYKYHGVIKAVADAVRKAGIKF
jgi:large subunit ribosomal protein L18